LLNARKLIEYLLPLLSKSSGLVDASELQVPDELLDYLVEENVLTPMGGNTLFLDRVSLAIAIVKSGGPIEFVASKLSWKEFEELVSRALEYNDFEVLRNFRFKHGERRREIDVIGVRGDLAICIDCKRLRHTRSRSSSLIRAVEKQVERVVLLSKSNSVKHPPLDKVSYLLPCILTLFEERFITINKVPIVPVFKLRSFLLELDEVLSNLFIVHVEK